MRTLLVLFSLLSTSLAFPQETAARASRVAKQGHVLKEGDVITSLVFSPNGNLLAIADTMGFLTVWDVKTGLRVASFRDRFFRGGRVAFSSDSRWIAFGAGWDLHLYKVGTWSEPYGRFPLEGSVGGLSFSPDGKSLACAVWRVGITLWNPDTGKRVRTFGGPRAYGRTLAFRPNGRQLASAGSTRSDNNSVRLWDVSRGELARAVECGKARVNDAAFSPDGRLLAAGSSSAILLWDTTSGRLIKTLESPGWNDALAFSSEGRLLASGGLWGIRIWDVVTGQKVRTLGSEYDASAIAFSPKRGLLASGGRDLIARLWDVSTGSEVRTLDGIR